MYKTIRMICFKNSTLEMIRLQIYLQFSEKTVLRLIKFGVISINSLLGPTFLYEDRCFLSR